jgi:hypothetical protein
LTSSRRDAAAVAVPDGRIFILGGHNTTLVDKPPLASIEVFDTMSPTPASVENPLLVMPQGVHSHGAAYANGAIYVMGGMTAMWGVPNDVNSQATMVLPVGTGTTGAWNWGPSLRSNRTSFGVASLAGVIYVIGGSYQLTPPTGGYTFVSPMDVLDTNGPSPAWAAGASIQTQRDYTAVIAMDSNQGIYLVGGRTPSWSYTMGSEIFFP